MRSLITPAQFAGSLLTLVFLKSSSCSEIQGKGLPGRPNIAESFMPKKFGDMGREIFFFVEKMQTRRRSKRRFYQEFNNKFK